MSYLLRSFRVPGLVFAAAFLLVGAFWMTEGLDGSNSTQIDWIEQQPAHGLDVMSSPNGRRVLPLPTVPHSLQTRTSPFDLKQCLPAAGETLPNLNDRGAGQRAAVHHEEFLS